MFPSLAFRIIELSFDDSLGKFHSYQWVISIENGLRIFFSRRVGGVYCGFSCFDCCGRWRSFSRSVLPEVNHRFFFVKANCALISELQSRGAIGQSHWNESTCFSGKESSRSEGRRFDWFSSFEDLSSQRVERVHRRIRSSTQSNTRPSKSGEHGWQLWNDRSIDFSTDCCRHRRWKWSPHWLNTFLFNI